MDETFNTSTATLTRKKSKNLRTKGDQRAKRNPSLNPRPLRTERWFQKLQKSKLLKMKKQKSEKTKSTAAAIANKVKPSEIINLDTDNEFDCSDVTMIPIQPPPTVIVEDSADEENTINEDIMNDHKSGTLENDENHFAKEDTRIKSALEEISLNRRSTEEIKDFGSTSHKIRQKQKNKKFSADDYNEIDYAHSANIKIKSTLNISAKGQEDGDQDRKSGAENYDNSPESSKSDPAPLETKKENVPPLYHTSLSWNNEMRVHCNDSWQAEPFILTELLQKINPDKDLWKICMEDRCNVARNKRRYNPKCTNCNQFGHKPSQCKKQRKPMICYMCGEGGHNEPRCPNAICLRCGAKTQIFTKSCNSCSHQKSLACSTCKVRGHSSDYCPDKWRQYHSITQEHINPNKAVKNNPRKYCCNCGARDHLSDDCRKAYFGKLKRRKN